MILNSLERLTPIGFYLPLSCFSLSPSLLSLCLSLTPSSRSAFLSSPLFSSLPFSHPLLSLCLSLFPSLLFSAFLSPPPLALPISSPLFSSLPFSHPLLSLCLSLFPSLLFSAFLSPPPLALPFSSPLFSSLPFSHPLLSLCLSLPLSSLLCLSLTPSSRSAFLSSPLFSSLPLSFLSSTFLPPVFSLSFPLPSLLSPPPFSLPSHLSLSLSLAYSFALSLFSLLSRALSLHQYKYPKPIYTSQLSASLLLFKTILRYICFPLILYDSPIDCCVRVLRRRNVWQNYCSSPMSRCESLSLAVCRRRKRRCRSCKTLRRTSRNSLVDSRRRPATCRRNWRRCNRRRYSGTLRGCSRWCSGVVLKSWGTQGLCSG